MKVKFSKLDIAEYLETERDMEGYFNACVDEDDGSGNLIRAALGDITRARGMMKVAESAGISRQGLHKALSPDGNPEFSTVLKIMAALNLKLSVKAS